MEDVARLKPTPRIISLREKTLSEARFLSLDQAKIITRVYKQNDHLPVCLKRAEALAQSLREMPLSIDRDELIVGNRSPGIRSGVVFPEAGITWLSDELDTLGKRPQDSFNVKSEDVRYFREIIEPFWKGKTLEDHIYSDLGTEIRELEKVVKINQKDHAQGHICPDVARWLRYGPSGILESVMAKQNGAPPEKADFYRAVAITLEASSDFMLRYSRLAQEMAEEETESSSRNLSRISAICSNLAFRPPADFREAVQSVWFLFVILQMESNASSFSPGRMDQYLYPWFIRDFRSGNLSAADALEILDSLFIKFNHIVYMRNRNSARYFAGFPTGFNITIGGQTKEGSDAVNELTWLFLMAQDHVRLPQPNLTARLHSSSDQTYINECTRVIGLGTGMPQIVNDESIIPALEQAGVHHHDAIDYALVGCVELSAQGKFLGWSDAAMFNIVKVLELTLNDGICTVTGEQTGLKTGDLTSFENYGALERAFAGQIDYFIGKMTDICGKVEKIHQQHLPSPFLSSVVNDCISKGMDVTAGGATYNFSGIQAIQVANIADSLAALKQLILEEKVIDRKDMLDALKNNFKSNETLRQLCIHKAPKYGNDIASVDSIGAKWLTYFAERLRSYTNVRGGSYNMGLYTVSAHVPMGMNVGATPDGRLANTPLADGGVSPMNGRDMKGPTAVLNSVSKLPFNLAPNGALLNMKFLPSFFRTKADREKFSSLLRSFVDLKLHHVQFNVVNQDDLLKAKDDPESYRGLTVRVAGYTAYFTGLAEDLQNEIIQRTSYGE